MPATTGLALARSRWRSQLPAGAALAVDGSHLRLSLGARRLRAGHPGRIVQGRLLGAHVRQIADPGGAVLSLIEAFEKARAHGNDLLLAPLACDLLLLLPRLRALPESDRAEILLRFHPLAVWLVVIFDRYAADSPPALGDRDLIGDEVVS